MNTENETGVKVPKGQINYNTVAGSLGIAAFAGLGLRNWFGNSNGLVLSSKLLLFKILNVKLITLLKIM